MPPFRWDHIVWPRWLPETARLPLVALITGAVALTALVMGPWWSRVPEELPATIPASFVQATPLPAAVPQAPALQPDAAKPVAVAVARPAHLNLDVRHSFGNVDLTVSVDGRRVLMSKLEGSGKKFKAFGKRAERSYTKSIDLDPGVRVVQVQLKSPADRFDQTRTERFDLASAAVASMRITADKSGLDVITQHPSTPNATTADTAASPKSPATAPLTAAPAPASAPVTTAAAQAVQRADAVAELVQSIRSMLIAIAGFVASAATGFVVQEYLRGRKDLVFAKDRRRRRRRESSAEISAP